jgi:hypothetical protein
MLRDTPASCDRSRCGLRRWSVLQFLAGIRGGARIAVAVGLLACFGLEGLWASTRAVPHRLAVHPNGATVAANQTQRFRVTDAQGRSVAVHWRVSGPGCSGVGCGTIDARGVYRTPSSLPQPPVVTLEGVLISDPNYSVLTQVQLVGGVTVAVSPTSAQVSTGTTQQFTATVVGSGNQVVVWSLSGAGCVGISCGTITGSGLYTAPATPPNPPTVTVKATSLADTSAFGTAIATVVSPPPITVAISPTAATVSPGGQQQFAATVTGTNDKSVTWNVTGTGCIAYYCGTITSRGLYTAPSAAPNPPVVTVTAYSHADPSKSASATVALSTPIVVTVSPASVQLVVGQQQQFSATVTGTGNTAVTWSVWGAGCSGAACGTITTKGLYTAPATVPSPPAVTVTATAAADSSKTGSSTVTLIPSVSVSVSPASIHVAPGAQQQFSATVVGTGNQVVTWGLSGPGCSGLTCGQITATGLYTAPKNIPSPNVVTVTAISLANPAASGTATVYVGAGSPVVVTVSPSSATVLVTQTQQFSAQVTGTNNTAVTWSVSGIGCAGTSCGTVSQNGLYTAPSTQPTPSSVTVTATSQADSTRSGSAIVTIAPNIVVSVSPTTAQVTTGQQAQFTATVTGSKNTSVTWSISGTGCSGKACGTISAAGLYTAPGQVPNPPNITVTATAQADPSKYATATVTVNAPVTVTVVPQTAQVVINAQQQFVATVTGTSNKSVNWSLSGKACPSSCGTIDSAGLYTAPAAVPGSAVTVTATSQANSSSSGSATVQVISSNNSRFKGQYAFLFRGTDTNGLYEAAGSFSTDGQGNITAGVEDVNRVSGPLSNIAFSGTYSVKGDNRGALVITSSQGTYSYAFALNSNANVARMIEIDNTGIRGAGVIKRQDPSAFSNSALTGGYTLNLTGNDFAGGRIGVLASVFPSGSGVIAGSSLDINDAGSVLPTFVNFQGAYNVTSNGRGTLSLTLPNFGNGKFNFAIYVVSASEFFLVSADVLNGGNPLFSGSALQQSGAPFSSSSFSGHSVFQQTGVSGGAPDVSVGLLTYDGHGTITIQFDENAGGTVQIGNTLNGAYAVSLNGRTTLNLVNSQTHQASTATMYAISQNTAFIMDSSASVRSGYLESQVVVPPFGDADFVGNYTFASSTPAAASVPLTSGVANFDGNGNVQGNEDEDFVSGPDLNQLMNGTYSISPVSQNGRGVIMLTLPQSETIAIWLASYSRAYGIPVDAGDIDPTVLIFEQ